LSKIIRIADLKKPTVTTNLELKVDRANEHLDEIHNRLRAEREPEPYIISGHDYPKKERHVIRIQSKPVPNGIEQILGDFAYCLRSGLDQLAWSLARLHVSCPRRATSFPIRDDPKVKWGEEVKDIPPDAVEVIKSLQPYHRGDRFKTHPLWILNRLCTIDKHRTVALHSTEIKVEVIGVSTEEWTFKHLDFGGEITLDIRKQSKLEIQPHPMKLIIGEPAPKCYGSFELPADGLGSIPKFIREEVVPKFASFT
jgi:hypothetical protein